MGRHDPLGQAFREKAEMVSAVVTWVCNDHEAMDYAVNLCERKQACQLLVAGCEVPLSAGAEALCQDKPQKIIAAPGLCPERFREMETRCADRGIVLVGENLRRHLAGIDVAFTDADYGIAETGTLVLDSGGEDLRLATMVCEVHVAVLPVSRLHKTAFELETRLAALMQDPAGYIAFITGASRTADIERVLALGVHGPLELHVLLLEDG